MWNMNIETFVYIFKNQNTAKFVSKSLSNNSQVTTKNMYIWRWKKFKGLLHPKKKRLDKLGKSQIMRCFALNNSATEFSYKLSCIPILWHPRVNRLKGKSSEVLWSMFKSKSEYLTFPLISSFTKSINKDATSLKDEDRNNFSFNIIYSYITIKHKNSPFQWQQYVINFIIYHKNNDIKKIEQN